MELTHDRRDGHEVIRIATEHVALTLLAATGRILEMRNLATGREVLRWNPIALGLGSAQFARLGGVGETLPAFDGLTWQYEENSDRIAFRARTADGVDYARVIALDRCWALIDLVVCNTTDDVVVWELDQAMDVLLSFGGAVPRPPTGIAHNRQKITIKRIDGPDTEEICYENCNGASARLHSVEWFAVTDGVTRDGLLVFAPAGIIDLHTMLSMSFRWHQPLILAPGAEQTVSFRMAVLSGLHSIDCATPRLAVGTCGDRLMPTDAAEQCVRAVNLGPPRQVKLAGCFTGKMTTKAEVLESFDFSVPLPDGPGIMPMRVEIDSQPLPVWVVKSDQVKALKSEYAALCQRARGARLSQSKLAAMLSFAHRFSFAQGMKPDAQVARIRELVQQAQAVSQSPEEVRRFYTADDLAAMRRLADMLDVRVGLAQCVEQAKARLREPFDFPRPVHRASAASEDCFTQSGPMAPAACLCAVTNDGELAELMVRRMLAFADCWERFGCVRHETIHNAVILIPLMIATDTLSQLGGIGLADETKLQAYFHDMIDQIDRYQAQWNHHSNWKGMERAALATHAAIHPYYPGSADHIRQALDTFERLLTQGTLADGCFWEMSIGYHQNVARHLAKIAEALLRVGTNLFDRRLAGRTLWELENYTAQMLTASGCLPRFEDSSYGVDKVLLVDYAKRYRDGRLVAAAKMAGWQLSPDDLVVPVPIPDEEPLKLRSLCFEPSGKLVFRDGTTSLFLDFGPHGGGHGDLDKLGIELFAPQGCIAPEAGTFRYEEALHQNWFKATKAHNTVTLGDRSQLPCCGRLVEFIDQPDSVRGVCEAETYPGVTHTRTVELRAKAYTITDVLEGALLGEELVWRLNSFTPFKVKGNVAETDDLEVEVLTGDVTIEVAEVPIMPSCVERIHDDGYDTGFQLRLRKRATSNREEIRVMLHPLARARVTVSG